MVSTVSRHLRTNFPPWPYYLRLLMMLSLKSWGNSMSLIHLFTSMIHGTCLMPMRRMRERDIGTEIGTLQEMDGRVERAASFWEEAMRRARRPLDARSLAAVGRILAKRSTART